MSEYRKAKGVELYDANVKIQVYPLDSTCFHEFRFPLFSISGFDLSDFLHGIGVEPYPVPAGKDKFKRFSDLEFEVDRGTHEFGQDFSSGIVKEILARVDAPGLLSLKVVSEWTETRDGKEEKSTWTQEFTCSGAFSVEWDAG